MESGQVRTGGWGCVRTDWVTFCQILKILPYWVMKARQLSTIIGISFLLSCCSLRVFPRPPAARWMSRYHKTKSDRAEPCRWSVLRQTGTSSG